MHNSAFDSGLIYVIEDNPITATITKILLEKTLRGSRVQLYANGQQALNQLAKVPRGGASLPDLILLDLNMPLMDGWEFLAAFNQLALGQPVCVLVLTSSINPEDRTRAARYQNVAGFFSKPLAVDTIARMLRLRRAANGPGRRTPTPRTGDALHHLVYQSRATTLLSEDELTQLLTQSRAFNSAHGLTGILLYSHGNIVQLLEGTETDVHAVFARISRDARHTGIVKLADGPVNQRLFAQWSMGFRSVEPSDFATVIGYVNPTHNEYLTTHLRPLDPDLHNLLSAFASDQSSDLLVPA